MARNKAGIYRDGKKWRIVTNISVNGELIRISKRGFDTQQEAYDEKNRIIAEYRAGGFVEGYVMVLDVLDQFLEFKSQGLKNANIYNIKKRMTKHLKIYERDIIQNIASHRELMRYKKYVNDLDVGTDYKNRIIKLHVELLTYAYNRGYITSADFKNVNLIMTTLKSSEKRKEQQIWSMEQFQAFLDVMDRNSRDYVLFALWGQIGARIGELRALQVKHFDSYAKSITINQQANSKMGIGEVVITTPKTKNANRVIYISETITEVLIDYILTLGLTDNDFLFTSAKNHILSEHAIRHAIKKYSALAGIPYLNPHGIRHSNTTWLLTNLKSIEDIGQISERLGHASKTTTLNIYYHINKAEGKDLANIIDFK